MIINIIEYKRPYGERYNKQLEISDFLKDKVKIIEDLGLKFTSEHIINCISICISDDNNDFDVCSELANSNAQEVKLLFEKMINEFTVEDYKEQLKNILSDEEFSKKEKQMPEEIIANKITCPYCLSVQDDEFYEQDETIEITCDACEKTFYLEQIVTIEYICTPDCQLNKEEHEFIEIDNNTYKILKCRKCEKIEAKIL